jgi:hypothetical protein
VVDGTSLQSNYEQSPHGNPANDNLGNGNSASPSKVRKAGKSPTEIMNMRNEEAEQMDHVTTRLVAAEGACEMCDGIDLVRRTTAVFANMTRPNTKQVDEFDSVECCDCDWFRIVEFAPTSETKEEAA